MDYTRISQQRARWIEIQAYFLILTIWKYRNNPKDILTIAETLRILDHTIDAETVYQIAMEMLNSTNIKPSKEEFCLICHDNKVMVKHIQSWIHVNLKPLYRMINEHKINRRLFIPKLEQEKIRVLYPFVYAFNKLRKAGIII